MSLLTDREEVRLKQCWSNRGQLDPRQWEELWMLVFKVLRQCHPSILGTLPDDKQDYITQFFLAKVYDNRFAGGQLLSSNALCTFFKNYLVDVQRHHAIRATSSIDTEAILDRMAEEEGSSVADGLACEAMSPRVDAEMGELLKEAARFYESLEIEEQIYLSLHSCDPDGEPLSKIAARYRIPSYHYRAGQLGVTRKKGDLPPDYEKTKIGRWMKDKLGLSIQGDAIQDIREAFMALCEAAIAMRDSLLRRLQHA